MRRWNSKFTSSIHYVRILEKYNNLLEHDGKVNAAKFFREEIVPLVPGYSASSWFSYLQRTKTAAGLIRIRAAGSLTPSTEQETRLTGNIVSNQEATQRGISYALNLGAKFYEDLMTKYRNDPNSLTAYEQRIMSDSIFKAMKSQDSRIHALGKVREDSREQAKFEHAFQDAATVE